MDLSTVNLAPLLTLLGKAGDETTEYQHAKAAGRVALVLFFLGLIGLLAGCAQSVFGADGKVGIIAGAIAACVAVLSKALTSYGYSTARADAKTAAGTAVAAVVAAAATAATAADAPLPVK